MAPFLEFNCLQTVKLTRRRILLTTKSHGTHMVNQGWYIFDNLLPGTRLINLRRMKGLVNLRARLISWYKYELDLKKISWRG